MVNPVKTGLAGCGEKGNPPGPSVACGITTVFGGIIGRGGKAGFTNRRVSRAQSRESRNDHEQVW